LLSPFEQPEKCHALPGAFMEREIELVIVEQRKESENKSLIKNKMKIKFYMLIP